MPLIIDALISVSDQNLGSGVNVKFPAYALIVEISLAATVTTPASRKFSALVDTGNFTDLTISEDLLSAWGGLSTSQFAKGLTASISSYGSAKKSNETQLYDADIWLYPNQSGINPILIPGTGRFVITAPRTSQSGEALSPQPPLIGQRVLHAGGLHLEIDYKALSFRISKA